MNNRLAMAASVLVRMGSALLAFVLIARGLGPVAYGLVATVFAYATLVSLVTDVGFTSKMLRDISAEPQRGGVIFNDCLSLKVLLTLAATICGGVVIWVMPKPAGTGLPIALLAGAVLIGAIGDLALTAYRATGRYAAEAMLTVATSIVHLAVIGWVAVSSGELFWIGVAFLVSRTIYACLAVKGAERLFVDLKLRPASLVSLWTNLRQSWAWAIDSGLSYLNSQIDGLLIVSFLGLQAAGVYQAGARFAQAALAIVMVLTSIHIPRITAAAARPGHESRAQWSILTEFALLGGVLAVMLWLGGPLITQYLLGTAYLETDQLWMGFGAFVFIRYVSAGMGVQLVALNRPLVRVVGQVIGLLIVILPFLILGSGLRLHMVPWIMSISSAFSAAFYMAMIVGRSSAKSGS